MVHEDVYLAVRRIAYCTASDAVRSTAHAVVRYICLVAAQLPVQCNVCYTGAGAVYSSLCRCIDHEAGHVAFHSVA